MSRTLLLGLLPLAIGCLPPPELPPELVSIDRWSHFCAGSCRHTLIFDGDVTLRIADQQDQELAEQKGVATLLGITGIRNVVDALDPSALEDVYGCPGCVDAPVMTLELDDGAPTSHRWPWEDPPPELQDVHDLMHDLRDALIDCSGSAWITPDPGCVPYSAP